MCLPPTHMINTYAQMAPIKLTEAEQAALNAWKHKAVEHDQVLNEIRIIENAKYARSPAKYLKGDKERICFLQGKAEVLKEERHRLYKEYIELTAPSVRDTLVNDYIVPALNAAGLAHHINEPGQECVASDKFYQFTPGCAKCRVSFRIYKDGTISDIEFNTPDEHRAFFKISRTWGSAKTINDLVLAPLDVSTSCLRFSPDGNDSHALVNLMSHITWIAGVLYNCLPTETGVEFLRHVTSDEEIQKTWKGYSERNSTNE